MAIPLPKAIRYELMGFVGFYLAVCVFILAYSPAVNLYVGHDVSLVFDGAWRLQNGQVPHKDFPSILGYGYLWQQSLFLKAFRYDSIAFAVSSIAVTTVALLIFFSFYSSDKFLKSTGPALRFYLFLLLLSLGLGQYHFGVNHTWVTYANLYNRYCFLGLFVLLLQTVLWKDAKTASAGTAVRLVVMALLLNYLFFVKLTYFVVAFAWLTLCGLVSVLSFRLYWRLLLISLFVFVALVLLTKADPLAMLRDYQTISAARAGVLTQPSFIRYKLFQYYNLAFLLCFAAVAFELFRRKAPVKHILLIGFIAGCAVLLQFTNWGATDLVMLTFVPALFILFPEYKKLLSVKFFMVGCAFFIFKNGRSIYWLTRAKNVPHSELKSPYLSRFYTDFKEVPCNEDYAAKVMSGAALVNRNKKPGERVFSFSFDNPFPFLTQTIPPRKVPLVWHYLTTFSLQVYTPPKELFSEVELLLIPKCEQAESAAEMTAIYGRTVSEHYFAIDRDGYWTLYRKRKPL